MYIDTRKCVRENAQKARKSHIGGNGAIFVSRVLIIVKGSFSNT